MNMQEQPQRGKWFQSRTTTLVLLGFIAIGGFFLVTEHTAHFFGLLPFALFLLCPLMMLFMHGGHGMHEGNEGHSGHDGNGGHDGHGGPSSGGSEPTQPPSGGQQ